MPDALLASPFFIFSLLPLPSSTRQIRTDTRSDPDLDVYIDRCSALSLSLLDMDSTRGWMDGCSPFAAARTTDGIASGTGSGVSSGGLAGGRRGKARW